jgi:hypothetical protein
LPRSLGCALAEKRWRSGWITTNARNRPEGRPLQRPRIGKSEEAKTKKLQKPRDTGQLAEVTPVVEFVGIFYPAIADIGAVVHVGDENVFDAGIDLGLRLLHGLAGADDDEDDAGSAGNKPLTINLLDVFDVDAFVHGPLENDGGVFGEGVKRFFVVEGKRRDDDADTDLEAAASAPLGIETVGEFPKKIADGSEDAFLLNADGGIAEARSEFERIDAVIVDDAVVRS